MRGANIQPVAEARARSLGLPLSRVKSARAVCDEGWEGGGRGGGESDWGSSKHRLTDTGALVDSKAHC